jgi:hypothetical protein
MSEKKSDNVRSRDDSHLRKRVSETREWMRAEGIEERPLDWEAIAREEQALWWRERLRQALAELAARSREFADSIAVRLRQLAAAAEAQAAAALEVTLDVAEQVGHVLAEPAQACLRPDAAMQFTYAPVALRAKLGVAESEEQGVGLFISSTIPGARVIADAHHRTLTIEFWETLPAPFLVLVPEDQDLATRVAEVVKADDTARAVFDNLPTGRYLLSIYVQPEEEQ